MPTGIWDSGGGVRETPELREVGVEKSEMLERRACPRRILWHKDSAAQERKACPRRKSWHKGTESGKGVDAYFAVPPDHCEPLSKCVGVRLLITKH